MRGLLLAVGARMPDSLRHGSFLEARLVLRDVEGIAHRAAVTFTVDRRAVIAKPKTQNLGLFEPSPANYGSGIADPATTRKPGKRDNVGALLLETTSGNKILMDEDE